MSINRKIKFTMSKAQVRSQLKNRLVQVSQDSIRMQSSIITKKIFELPYFKDAKRIALYMNMPHSEVQTLDIIKLCFDYNKEVYLPRCNFESTPTRKRNHLSMLRVPSFEDITSLKPSGPYNLLEPKEGEDILESGGLDVIIVPGVAFSLEGRRLGHGAGFYDEFLSTYKTKFGVMPYLLGVCLREQILSNVPVDVHDWHMDQIISS